MRQREIIFQYFFRAVFGNGKKGCFWGVEGGDFGDETARGGNHSQEKNKRKVAVGADFLAPKQEIAGKALAFEARNGMAYFGSVARSGVGFSGTRGLLWHQAGKRGL